MKHYIKAVAVQGRAQGLIDDEHTTSGTTYSSEKIEGRLTDKVSLFQGSFSRRVISYKSTSGSVAGFVQIRFLDANFWCNNMLSFKVRVSEHPGSSTSLKAITEFVIYTYAYQDKKFHNSCVTCLSSASSYKNAMCWFGADANGNPCILISKVNTGSTTFYFPQVDVYDFSSGYLGEDYDYSKNCSVHVMGINSTSWASEHESMYCSQPTMARQNA